MTPELPSPYIYANGYLTLPVPTIPPLPAAITFEGTEYHLKTEFHVSLVRFATVAEHIATAAGRAVEDVEQGIAARFADFVREHPIALESYLDDVRHAVKGPQETIVIRCRISNLDAFFALLEDEYVIALPHQPAHVTLYRNSEDFVGISISDPAAMESYGQVRISEIDSAFMGA